MSGKVSPCWTGCTQTLHVVLPGFECGQALIINAVARICSRIKQHPSSVQEAIASYHANAAVRSVQAIYSMQLTPTVLVLFPPLPEQRKIAEILRTWDEAIEKLEALKAVLT